MMFAAKKASPELDALIARARNAPPMTEAEIKAQRDSFARAELGFGSDEQEAEYAAALLRGDDETVKRCEAEAQVRMAKFDEPSGG